MRHQRQDYNLRIQDSAGLIPANEPVMLFRASDQDALYVLRMYRSRLQQKGNPMWQEILHWEREFEHWAANHGTKCPDSPTSATDKGTQGSLF